MGKRAKKKEPRTKDRECGMRNEEWETWNLGVWNLELGVWFLELVRRSETETDGVLE